jgi:hypothetical protein
MTTLKETHTLSDIVEVKANACLEEVKEAE